MIMRKLLILALALFSLPAILAAEPDDTAALPQDAEDAASDSEDDTLPLDTIEYDAERIQPVIINGVTARLKVDPSIFGALLVNPDVASAMKLKPSFLSLRNRVGPIIIKINSDRVKVDYGATIKRRRTLWADRSVTSKADGIIGPGALPYKIIRFRLAPSKAGEHILTFPISQGGIFSLGAAKTTPIKIGDQEVHVAFNLDRDDNIATAPVANLIAQQFGGTLTGEPRPAVIVYEVARPVRRLALARPFIFAGRNVDPLMVRVSDYGDVDPIPDDSKAEADANEIVVTAKKGQRAYYILYLGQAYLKGCSLLTYDFEQKQIRLSCSDQG